MKIISDLIKKVFFAEREEPHPPVNIEELRATFKARYHHFKLLLSANNKALEIMIDMEQALRGNRPFGMSFIRANCTAISANVFQIIKNLNAIAPGKYEELLPRFTEIQKEMWQLISHKKLTVGDRMIIPLRDIDKDMVDEVGSKMANVGEIRNQIQLRVPDGFVISSLAYQKFMEHNDLQSEIDRLIQASVVERMDQLYSLSAEIQQLIIRAEVPEVLTQAIMEAYRELEKVEGKGVSVSLRSSALGEDMAGTSFAGQYRSELNVSAENIIHAYKGIIASKYGLPAMSYRRNRGIRDEDIAMSVGCMAMVQAVSGGVMYSCNPTNIRDSSVFINSVWGLPKSVVDGSTASDLFVVSRETPMSIRRKEIRLKEYTFVCYPEEGVCRLDTTGERAESPSISDDQALELAKIALQLERYYGSPQDIEWGIDSAGKIYLLQCRPLQQSNSKTGPTPSSEGHSPDRGEIEAPILLHGGVTASSGVGCGPVFIVRKDMDTLQFPDGAVLVAAQSLPRWATVLNRAAAVVTEQGSVAGHLANVSREFGVPALLGVSEATQKLNPGDLITVDADGLTIYEGRVETLLETAEPPKNLMEGSPVYSLLERVMYFIAPLTLLDPESPDFHPKKCQTLHDITRFCHEMSVHEMFDFGGDLKHFPERSSKQLVYKKVRMQFWIINLDDGFKEEVKGKYIRVEDIVSVPMVALWEGMIAIQWQGPPAVDTKGLMHVMAQAATNPALDPSSRSSYAARNYFMISKNFCSVQSRFGFHFSTVEALVSERALENYVSFQFKGGAADYQRRVRRASFVSGILTDFGFRTEIREDAVFARIEGLEETVMKEKLRILGYLIIHTRQLDMIMSNQGVVNYYGAKIRKDIDSILEKKL